MIVTNRSETTGNETLRLIRETGGEGSFVKLDISVPEDIVNAIDFAVETYGRLDCAVNNAAVEQSSWVFSGDTAEDDIDSQLTVNLNLNTVQLNV